jgi:flagellar biosynthesis protein FliP
MRLPALVLLLTLVLGAAVSPAIAVPLGPPAPGEIESLPDLRGIVDPVSKPNPLSVLGEAASLFTSGSSDVAGGGTGELGAGANDPEREGFSVALSIMILLTAITLVPSIMIMTTCFVRILIVLALLRQAIGTQAIPPAQVVTGLALFLTAMVMAPTVERVWDEAITPYSQGELTDYDQLWDRAKQPLRDYMFDQIEATGNWSSVYMLLEYRGVDTSAPGELTRADVDMTVLVPAYMLGELKVGFLMGFRVYLPVPGHRHGHREHPDLDEHDDAAPGAHQPAVQAAAVRVGGRVGARGGEPARDVRAGGNEPARLGTGRGAGRRAADAAHPRCRSRAQEPIARSRRTPAADAAPGVVIRDEPPAEGMLRCTTNPRSTSCARR